jgi:transcription antitermination factor NusG
MEPAFRAAGKPLKKWYALHVRSRHEKAVAAALDAGGWERFLPLYHERRRWSDRWKQLDLPLFPGYAFCRLDSLEASRVVQLPGVVAIVGFGGHILPVDDAEIGAIQAVIRSGLGAEPWPRLESGRKVRVRLGPLSGLEGVVVRQDKKSRLVVAVTLLRRSVAVDVQREWVAPAVVPRRTCAIHQARLLRGYHLAC